MKLSALICKKESATATDATFASVSDKTPSSVATVANVAVALAKDRKSETQQERQREARRQRVIAMLKRYPDTARAIYTDTISDPHNVILTVAVRACQQTCELLIPKAKYDPWRLLDLVERYGQTTH